VGVRGGLLLSVPFFSYSLYIYSNLTDCTVQLMCRVCLFFSARKTLQNMVYTKAVGPSSLALELCTVVVPVGKQDIMALLPRDLRGYELTAGGGERGLDRRRHAFFLFLAKPGKTCNLPVENIILSVLHVCRTVTAGYSVSVGPPVFLFFL
jgi:hypothetical protein